ncbi:Hydroxymethylglutaryl-coenzyme A synthase [Ancylostoma caninum]|uniref:Hydroxymethylglutaryl-coenzyme A synthase n=1 Tax=Ancylostoma caninum TaxID=29170 RepID=A0A368FJS6_ANCCA|nr:Hydroxymethylglutaryl-coenzyme A synthase [Ancylostoma caninum]
MIALDGCYRSYKEKVLRISEQNVSLSSFSAAMFHSPFTRMVQKALARLSYRDHEYDTSQCDSLYSKLGTLTASSFEDREVMKCLLKGSEELWKAKTCPYLELNRRIGNMYTPSLFAQLVAYIASGHSDELNRILFFAYGSGSAAAMFSATLNVSSSVYQRMMEISRRAVARLEERHICAPEQYTDALKMREEFLASDVPIIPKGNSVGYSTPTLFPGTYFLKMVDERYRRVYDRSPLSETTQNHVNGYMNGAPGESSGIA